MMLKAMTYNIYSGYNLKKEYGLEFAASVINQVQPHFVTLNEVNCYNTRSHQLSQADELGRLCGYYPVFGKAIDFDEGEYGNAFLTRLPLVEKEIIDIPDPENPKEGEWYEHRSILRCVLLWEGKKITVLSTHFGLSPEEQVQAVKQILAVAEKETNPVIVQGDLNLTPDNELLAPLFKKFHDTCAGKWDMLSFPSGAPKMKIDYILHDDYFETQSAQILNTQCSDHRPLIATLCKKEK